MLHVQLNPALCCCAPPQVGSGHSCPMRWQTAATRWRIYPGGLRTYSGWAASTRQAQDPWVTLQHQLLWQLILKARAVLPNKTSLLSNVLFYDCKLWDDSISWSVTCNLPSPFPSLLYRDSHPSGPDWAEGVKGYWIKTSSTTEELQFPLRDQQVGFLQLV